VKELRKCSSQTRSMKKACMLLPCTKVAFSLKLFLMTSSFAKILGHASQKLMEMNYGFSWLRKLGQRFMDLSIESNQDGRMRP
jgi:hypothetical protein